MDHSRPMQGGTRHFETALARYQFSQLRLAYPGGQVGSASLTTLHSGPWAPGHATAARRYHWAQQGLAGARETL